MIQRFSKVALNKSHMTATAALRDAKGEQTRHKAPCMVISWIILATQQTARKVLYRKGCASIGRSLRQAPRHRSYSFEQRRAPVDHPVCISNAAYGYFFRASLGSRA